MTLSRRERVRKATITEIKAVARQQMAEQGAAALSLGAIARAMGMTTPALYRYFTNRDALVTELVVEAYQALGDVLEENFQAHQHDPYDIRFMAICNTYRNWAVAYPQGYTLIYGTPIPNYHAPRERTVDLASRVIAVFGRFFGEAQQAGKLTIPAAYQQLSPKFQQVLANFPLEEATTSIFILTILIWSRINAVVWSALYEHFPPGMADSGELFQIEMQVICHELNLDCQ